MYRKIILSCLALILASFAILGVWTLRENLGNNNRIPRSAKYDFNTPTPPPIAEEKPTRELRQTAWIPDWDYTKGLESFKQSSQYFYDLSPVWYYLEDGGKVREAKRKLDETIEITKAKGVKLIPSIACFDPEQMAAVLANSETIKQHVDYLIAEVNKHDFDGIDIDYEAIYFKDQSSFLELLRQLYTQLDAKGKTLSVTVLSKWTDQRVLGFLTETRNTQDWYEIAQVAHEVRIMAYEVTGLRSSYPGPISPLPWVEAILSYAARKLPPEKTVLALPQYAYDGWSRNLVYEEEYIGLNNPTADKFQASAYVYSDILSKLDKQKQNYLDPISKEKVLIYTDQDIFEKNKQKLVDYIAFYQDAETTQYRVDLAKKYGIAGIAHWRMGGEDLGAYAWAKRN